MYRTAPAALLLFLALTPPAHAYIDPGTGSLILQGLVAFVVGAAFTLKMFFHQRIKPIIDWILRRPKQPEPQPPAGADADPHKH